MKLLKDETGVPTTWAEVAITDDLVTSNASAATTAGASLCRKVAITYGTLPAHNNSVYTC